MSLRIGDAKDLKSLVQALEVARKRREQLRLPFEKIWWDNLALIAGNHWEQWDEKSGLYMDRDLTWTASDKKPRIVLNHAMTVRRTELAKLTKSQPIMEIMAQSDEDTDIQATKVGLAVLDYVEWKFNLRKKRKQVMNWMLSCGLGAMYVGWDWINDDAGNYEFMIDPETGEPIFAEDRKAEIKALVDRGDLDQSQVVTEKYPLGELDFRVYSPFQLLPDETVLDLDDCKDLITVDAIDYDVACGLWDEAKKCVPEDLNLGTIEKSALVRAGLSGPKPQELAYGLKVFTWWCLPNTYRANKFLRDGFMLRWCQGQHVLEHSKAFPYQDNRMPFSFYQHITADAVVWPESITQHIRGPNLEIDKTVSQLLANKDYMANPMWRIATQHQIKGKIKNVAGGIVRYVHVPNIPPPEPLPGIPMPSQVENLVVGLRNQILDISGQSEVSRGRTPSGVRSGVAVAYLQEEDDTKIAPTTENVELAVAHEGSLVLERVQQFYSTERIVRYYRRDGIFEVLKFKGADLKNNTDVVSVAGSALPKSKAARQQYILELASLGIEQDPKKLKEMLDIGQGEPDDYDKAVRQADRENQKMLHGMQRGLFQLSQGATDEELMQTVNVAVPVKKWHNHQLHLTRHYSIMMDEEFDRLTTSHPQIVRLFDEHTAMHEQMMQEALAAQQQALLAAKGAPDGPPGQAQQPSNGAGQATTMVQQDVADPIGGGAVDISSRQIRPQPGQ